MKGFTSVSCKASSAKKIARLISVGRIQLLTLVTVLCLSGLAYGQLQNEVWLERGNLWEDLQNDGWIGNLGSWDYLTPAPLGLFPGFPGYNQPVGNEEDAVDTYENCNFHNFRSGIWITVPGMEEPGLPPAYTPTSVPYEVYLSGLQDQTYGVASVRAPIILTENHVDTATYNPALPEEMSTATWNTDVGITVTCRSYDWSFPGYRDFIIYDYVFKNTDSIVSNQTQQVVSNFPSQTLKGVVFTLTSGISVSTKSQINFHSELTAVQAGGFGWQPGSYHDYYHHTDDNTLFFSTNYNGGAAPLYWWDPFPLKPNSAWTQKFGNELESPAAFGWLCLYASPTGGTPRTVMAPDFWRIDSHKGGTFQGKDFDLEFFRLSSGVPKQEFYQVATTPDTQAALGNKGNRLNFYTLSYGPYNLAPGDSVRIIQAEIAGVMDYHEVTSGDSSHWFPDSTIAAIERNATNARDAIKWGMGATVDGIPIAANVPAPPPGPHVNAVNGSRGTQKAIIDVTWDRLAENSTIKDGAGNSWFSGAADVDGYRVYRSTDFQYVSDTQPSTFRGAAWNLIADIPKADFGNYWNPSLNEYEYPDSSVQFGVKYGYYVAAYWKKPAPWTSVNGTVVTNLPQLQNGDYNYVAPASAAAGPVTSFDIYVVPNPYVYNSPLRSFGINDPFKIEFRNLPAKCVIRIYTIGGDLIRTIIHGPDSQGNEYGTEDWDQKSDSGLLVAPGLYIYNVQSTTPGLDKSFTGKLMIIR